MENHESLASHVWDAVVIGTGMGGATIGFQLARHGKKVLFIEKGKRYDQNPRACYDNFAETFLAHPPSLDSIKKVYADAGRCKAHFFDRSGRENPFIPFIGAGTGGSSALYGGAMERFFPQDFSGGAVHCDPASSLPEKWPITYQELATCYEQAEKLYGLVGSPDPLRPGDRFAYKAPDQMVAASRALYDGLSEKGLHPYRLPVAYDPDTECRGCQGFLCSYRCKNDSSKICLEPAVDRFGAKLITECEVIRFQGTADNIESVICKKNNHQFPVRATHFFLAAGAVISPLILLNSVNAFWPEGIGNRSGLVGKNLMRHHIDLWAVQAESFPVPGNKKEIAFNDFYVSGDDKFGTVQSFGALPPADVLFEEIRQDIQKKSSVLSGGFSLVKPLVTLFLHRMFAKSVLLASIKEDLPYVKNNVHLGNKPGEPIVPVLEYALTSYEKNRIKAFRDLLKKTLKPARFMLLKQSENIERIAHVCGTCRFGDDPEKSVLDKFNRVHGIQNLFVVDSSFFPSSGGTNPSLTIAANALRVADNFPASRQP